MEKKVEEIGVAMNTMAEATDKGIGDIRKELEQERKERKTFQAEMGKKYKEVKEDVGKMEVGGGTAGPGVVAPRVGPRARSGSRPTS